MNLRSLLLGIVITECVIFAGLALAAEVDIDQVNQKFSKSSVSVAVGDTLNFQNGDDVTHNIQITADGGDPDDQGLQKPGEKISYKFAKAGDYDIRCAIHPRMKMTVAVK